MSPETMFCHFHRIYEIPESHERILFVTTYLFHTRGSFNSSDIYMSQPSKPWRSSADSITTHLSAQLTRGWAAMLQPCRLPENSVGIFGGEVGDSILSVRVAGVGA
jgi:hypothetical protein